MKKIPRITPSLVIALLALFFAIGGSAPAVDRAARPVLRCGNGSIKAYASIDLDRFAGAFPTQFSSSPKLFATRWVCNGATVSARNAGPGIYEVRFPGITSRMVVVSSLSPYPSSASWTFGAGAFQVQVAKADGTPSNFGFSIAVY
jgi:hypothetical protein